VFHRVKQTRTAQWLRRALGDSPQSREGREQNHPADFFTKHQTTPDDPIRDCVYANFQDNLRRICGCSLEAGASVILSTVAVNLRDCPPLASLHRSDLTARERDRWDALYRKGIESEAGGRAAEAITYYRQAAEIDNHYAELHFHLARCSLAGGDRDAATRHFALARDWDALQFRTDSRLNEIIRHVAAECGDRRVHLVDAEKALANSSRCPDGIVGGEFFYEYVHFRFEGDYEMARALLPAVVQAIEQDRGIVPSQSSQVPTREQCARELAFTRWDEVNTLAAMAELTAKPPFTGQLDHAARQARIAREVKSVMDRVDGEFVDDVIRACRQAIEARPNDWQLRYNLGAFLHQLERYDEAARELDRVVQMLPQVGPFRTLLAYALGKAGHWDQAIDQFREVLKRDRHDKQAREGLAWARDMKKKGPESRRTQAPFDPSLR
jgi:tetratricopeptide (TPR) repeat protein